MKQPYCHKYIRKGPNGNKIPLELSEPMVTKFNDAYATPNSNELTSLITTLWIRSGNLVDLRWLQFQERVAPQITNLTE